MIAAQFDSDILIDALNGHRPALAEIRRAGSKSLSRLSWIEIMAGADEKSARAVESFLSSFTIDEVTEAISRRAAQLSIDRKGLTLASAIVLASAQISGRILVTRNTKDFPANMPGIRIPYQL